MRERLPHLQRRGVSRFRQPLRRQNTAPLEMLQFGKGEKSGNKNVWRSD
ncbi:unnamed protein product [Leptidea sinapis]|uniref:Uncharacterized protein n=1 Tax=Leptidea sinapis TaxID=189913 RepID=A0A5E4R0I4_9NEOP|nr:unnamed protein product [Leptidea sinapis]